MLGFRNLGYTSSNAGSGKGVFRLKTYIRRAVLIALFICLVGGGVYLGGVQLLKSVQRSEALGGITATSSRRLPA